MRRIFSTAVTCLSITALAQSVNAQVSSDSEVTLEEVVVTAQKREERLQDVPISITVLSGDALEKSNDRGVSEALNRVPGVFAPVTANGARGGGNATIVVRGVSSMSVGSGTTAYYLDSTPYGQARNAFVPDSNPYDLDRVEVLRGPQGTLYGSSALNGVVRILTKSPNFQDFEFKARGSLASTDHGSESYTGDAAFNLPLIQDKLALRVVLGYQELGGWIDKPLLGKEDVNDTEKSSARVKLAAQLTDNFSLGATAWFSRTDSGGKSFSDDGGFNYASQPVPGYPGYVGFDEPSSIDFDSYSLDLGYDTSVVAIKSTTSYLDYRSEGAFDNTYTNIIGGYAPLLNVSRGGGSRVFTEELVLNSVSDGPWRWTLGAMYRNAQDDEGPGDDTPPNDVYSYESKSTAVYGELTRLFADGRYELTGGLRYFTDDVKTWELSRSDAPNGIPPGGLQSLETTFKKTTPRVVATWHPSKDATLYASYSKGFRSGLFQNFTIADLGFQPVDPDTLTNYEIGAKASALGGRLGFDGAVYYIDWKDPQIESAQFVPLLGPVPAFRNGGTLSGVGVDLAVTYLPIDSLMLGLNAGWNDLTYEDAVFGLGGGTDYPKGGRRANSPEIMAGATIAYTMKLGSSGYSGRLSASANYTDEQITGVNPLTSIQSVADATTLVRTGFTLEAPKHWNATLYVDNVTDENGYQPDPFAQPTLGPTSPAPNAGVVIRPRTVGLQLEYKY